MKRLGQVLGGVLAVVLTVFSMQVMAAAQVGGRDFNHMTTGFPLAGIHGTTACETCHIGGVFKGTPRACDGCHALGKRIVATPKSTSHITTDAACDACHFNTSTFLGARFNHGSALPGQCQSCHNGRNAQGKPASHNSGKKLTASCDSCHRSLAFLPASWNHVGVVPGTCSDAGCHEPSSGNPFTRNTPLPHTRTGMLTLACDRCHSVVSWRPPIFDHLNAGATCINCHNGAYAVSTPAGHTAIGTSDCDQCHMSGTVSWLPALGGKPANHIPYNAGVTCKNCHTGLAKVPVGTIHPNTNSYTCATCHISPNPYTGNNQKTKSTHKGSSGSNCSNCHNGAASYSNWNA